MNKQQRFLIVLTCCFIFFTLSVPVLNMAPVTSDSLYSQQDLMYYLSQDNQTEFNNYSMGNLWTYHPTCSPSVYIDVVDLDGVVSVWFSYKRSNESQWNNKSMVSCPPFGEDAFSGSFSTTVSESSTGFNIKFFANDSLGHISESELYGLSVRYDIPTTTPTTEPVTFPLIPFLALLVVIVTIIAVSLKIITLKLNRSS